MTMRTNLLSASAALLSLGLLFSPAAHAQQATSRADWAGQGQLFVGTCYQPVDRTPAQITQDIAHMKQAGLTVVRMGDLSWDYFEPANGKFTFAAFDSVMDQMHAAGIKVLFDLGGSPAPQWLHYQYPGVTLVQEDGSKLYPAERYMDNILDPDYRRLLHRFADKLLARYGKHPAVIAIGFNNEIGNGYMSFSEPVRQRFIGWLKAKYGNLDKLNHAWAAQRWSRTISNWDQVRLPSVAGVGPNERYLDLRRFWSDATLAVLDDLEALRKRHAPAKPAISNLFSDAGRRGFDYLSTYRRYTTHGAFGYYAGNVIAGAFETMMMKGGMTAPVWFNEFQAGNFGFYGEKGRSRMLMYFGLLNGGQGMLAWNYNSHLGGEEQIIFGLIDHNDKPSWKLAEWGATAREFQTMQQLGFPRELKPEVALSYSWESRQAASRQAEGVRLNKYYGTPYRDHKYGAFAPLYNDNLDVAVINIAHEDLTRYKLLVIAGEYLMDQAATDAVRKYVAQGGTVVMTAQSDKTDGNNQWHSTDLPGQLADVFGLTTQAFYQHTKPLTGTIDGVPFKTSLNLYEVLEPTTAQVLARFNPFEQVDQGDRGNSAGQALPAITSNQYGKGRAIYVATLAQPSVLQPLYRQLYRELGIARGPVTPDGVYARVVDGRTLYVNTTRNPVDIAVDGHKNGILTGKTWNATLQLPPLGVEVLQ
jgi:beta-galactosidase